MTKVVIANTDSPKDSRVPINNMFTELYEMKNVHDATSKTTPVDADELGLWDSVYSTIKKLTWANLKAAFRKVGDLTSFSDLSLATGQVINGKIVVTVASNNITLALKGANGNDPSATNPVYCKIGGVIRSVTAALSVTKNAGTKWCNAGSAELATKEIDYFAYLGYNATDGVTLGFSRIPFACQYSDFSVTTTNEKYAAISTITNAAATDYYNVIGRFAATLSAYDGYTWTVPTFTATNLIQRPIWETRWLTCVPTHSASASMTFTSVTGIFRYKLVGDTMLLTFTGNGTLGGTVHVAIYATTPFTFVSSGGGVLCVNNNTQISGAGRGENTNSVEMYVYTGGNWILSANSGYRFNMSLQIA